MPIMQCSRFSQSICLGTFEIEYQYKQELLKNVELEAQFFKLFFFFFQKTLKKSFPTQIDYLRKKTL